MNELIHLVWDAGMSEFVYKALIGMSFIVWFVFNLFYRKRYKFTVAQSFVIPVAVWGLGLLLIMVLFWIENHFSNWGSQNLVRGFIYFPLIAIPFAKLMKLPPRAAIDFVAPGIPLCQGAAHWACMFRGCCHGYPSTWGIWNPIYDKILFPIPALEAIVALLIVVVVVLYAKKEGYQGTGKVYALMLVLFGSTRFFLEFLRDNEKIFGNISVLALHAALMFVVGIVWLCYIWDKEARAEKRKSKVKY